MNKAIRELAAICKEHRFDEKLLFVPSYAIGHQIGEFLARSGYAGSISDPPPSQALRRGLSVPISPRTESGCSIKGSGS